MRSLLNLQKRVTFANFVATSNIILICLTETWLTEQVDDAELFLPNYELFWSERASAGHISRHCGFLIGVRRDTLAETLSVTDDDFLVSCTAVVNGCKLIDCCYNPPANSDYRVSLVQWTSVFSRIRSLKESCSFDELLFYGDFNVPLINWSTCLSDDFYSEQFVLMTEGIDLVQQVRRSTRKRNTLYLFFTQEKFPVAIT